MTVDIAVTESAQRTGTGPMHCLTTAAYQATLGRLFGRAKTVSRSPVRVTM